MSSFLNSTVVQFKYYKSLGDKTFVQLTDDELFWQSNSDSNSIAIIVKHMWGNMLSRWTDFLTSDGEKEWRNRDAEFESDIKNREELLQKWEEGWQCLFTALDSVDADKVEELVYIRNQGHTIIEAVNRQLAHYAYHVGQLVLIAKILKAKDWKTLSIAKGKSKEYNKDKFSKPKQKKHFTSDYIKTKEPQENS